jgi:hypothetical protein
VCVCVCVVCVMCVCVCGWGCVWVYQAVCISLYSLFRTFPTSIFQKTSCYTGVGNIYAKLPPDNFQLPIQKNIYFESIHLRRTETV